MNQPQPVCPLCGSPTGYTAGGNCRGKVRHYYFCLNKDCRHEFVIDL